MKKIAFVGKSAVGKNHFLDIFTVLGYKPAIGHTTRAPRTGEQEGKDYHFVSKEEFAEMILKDEFIQFMQFQGEYYGTTKEEFEKCDFFITSPTGLENIPENLRWKIKIAELICENKVTMMRRQIRDKSSYEDHVSRNKSDDKLFENFDQKMKDLGYDHVKIDTATTVEKWCVEHISKK
jgi:guanylate kinase